MCKKGEKFAYVLQTIVSAKQNSNKKSKQLDNCLFEEICPSAPVHFFSLCNVRHTTQYIYTDTHMNCTYVLQFMILYYHCIIKRCQLALLYNIRIVAKLLSSPELYSQLPNIWSSPCVITFFPISKFSYFVIRLVCTLGWPML